METETLPSMLQARCGHAAVIVGGQLVCDWRHWTPTRHRRHHGHSIEVLDLNDPREWKLFPVSLEIARYCCSAVAVNE